MSMVTPTLNLPQPALAATAKPAAPPVVPASPAMPPAAVPSTTVTLSPQAQSALAAAGHPASASVSVPVAASATQDGSMYESLKNGIVNAVGDVGDAIAGGAHAVVDGVEATLSTANDVVKGALGLPFAAVAKVCDAAGAVIDKL